MAISCIKTITGDDLIGDITVNGDTLTIDTPLSLVVVPSGNNQYSIALAPFMPFSATKIYKYHMNHVVLFYDGIDEIRNDYQRVTGKGIIIPSRPKLELV